LAPAEAVQAKRYSYYVMQGSFLTAFFIVISSTTLAATFPQQKNNALVQLLTF
jgi:hypothetical protein